MQGPFGPPSSVSKNMALTFQDSNIKGLITASTAVHPGAAAQDGISAEDYREIGVITNTPAMPVNNGVLVVLAGHSQWTVTGTSYLTKLVVGADASVVAPEGMALKMYVDGQLTAITPGQTYTGMIEIRL